MYVNLIEGVLNMRIFIFILGVLILVLAGGANAGQSFTYLVGSITDFNNLVTTSPNKFSHKTDYGPYYFSTDLTCEAVKTAIEGNRPTIIPSAQKDNVIGNDLSKLVRVSTLQCLPITQ